MTRDRKIAVTAALFAAGLAMVGVSMATMSAMPLFLSWAPLLAAAWVLRRPEPPPPGPEPTDRSESEPAGAVEEISEIEAHHAASEGRAVPVASGEDESDQTDGLTWGEDDPDRGRGPG